MAEIAQLFIYPIKSLCGVPVDEVNFTLGLGLRYDREWCLLDSHGRYINGKAYPACHRIKLHRFTPPATISLSFRNESRQFDEVTFNLHTQAREAEQWFGEVFSNTTVSLIHRDAGTTMLRYCSHVRDNPGFLDDPRFDGPTIVSRATLDSVEEWFCDAAGDAHARFRPNIIVSNVAAFWEDSLLTEDETVGARVTIGESCQLVSVFPVHRCVVPSRASSTSETPGRITEKFFEQFQEHRKNNYHPQSPVKRLTSNREKNREAYYLCTAADILVSGRVRVGDALHVKDFIMLQPAIQSIRPLSKKALQKLIDGAYCIRELDRTTQRVLTVLIQVLPVAVIASIIGKNLPDSCRKPTTEELAMGYFKVLAFILVVFVVLLAKFY